MPLILICWSTILLYSYCLFGHWVEQGIIDVTHRNNFHLKEAFDDGGLCESLMMIRNYSVAASSSTYRNVFFYLLPKNSPLKRNCTFLRNEIKYKDGHKWGPIHLSKTKYSEYQKSLSEIKLGLIWILSSYFPDAVFCVTIIITKIDLNNITEIIQ